MRSHAVCCHRSDDEVVEVALTQADGFEHVFPAGFKGLVFYLNHSAAAAAAVVEDEDGDEGALVHIAQTRQLRAHVLQRVGSHIQNKMSIQQ